MIIESILGEKHIFHCWKLFTFQTKCKQELMQNKYQSGSATQISLAIGKTNMNSTAVHQTKT